MDMEIQMPTSSELRMGAPPSTTVLSLKSRRRRSGDCGNDADASERQHLPSTSPSQSSSSFSLRVIQTVLFLSLTLSCPQPTSSMSLKARGSGSGSGGPRGGARRPVLGSGDDDDEEDYTTADASEVYHTRARTFSLSGLPAAAPPQPARRQVFGLSSLLSVPSSPVSVLLPLALPASSAYHRRRAAAAAAAVNFRRSLRRSPRNTDYCRNPNPLEYQRRSRVCQNCQKITKAPGAYDQCCNDVDNAYNWCERIYEFTSTMG